jgi:hypothetical protein
MKKLKEIWNHDIVVNITIVVLIIILFLEVRYLLP